MLDNFDKYVVVLCLFYLFSCVCGTSEYLYDDNPAEEVKSLGSFIDDAVSDQEGKLAEIKKAQVNPEATDPGGGGEKIKQSAQSSVEEVSDGLHLESRRSITGLATKTQYIIIAVVCSVVALSGIVIAVSCWCRLQNREKGEISSASGTYPGYGVTGPSTHSSFHEPGDRKLAQSAQMYHYQYKKQQMIDFEKSNDAETKNDTSDEEEEDKPEDYLVYEAPGLAKDTNDIEINNPLFQGQIEDSNGFGTNHMK